MILRLIPLVLFVVSCGGDSQATAPTVPAGEVTPEEVPSSSDESAPAERFEAAQTWLDLAFECAAKMPHEPHIKNRSRFQAQLAEAAIEAGLVDVAEGYAPRIHNWRKGHIEAQLAVHLTRQGREEDGRRLLNAAIQTEEGLTAESDQGWRRDRVRASIAEVLALLGDEAAAAKIQAGLDATEAGRLAPLSVQSVTAEQADERMDMLEGIAKTGELETIKYALLAIAEFYGRFYDDKKRRDGVQERIRRSWKEIPIEPRVEILERLAQIDLEHGNTEEARITADEIASMIEEVRWSPEDGVAMRTRVAKLLAAADEPKSARRAADEALALYEASAAGINSIFRGDALVPLAEAYASLGDRETAGAMYGRALEEAMVNPNGRPQLEDYVDVVTSLARMRFEPPVPLAKRLRATAEEIDAPW